MCVVSMVMDHYYEKWGQFTNPNPPVFFPVAVPAIPTITPEEIAELKKLLERAREYDRKNNEPDCELAEKRDRVKKLAEELGVKIDFV